MFESKLIRCPTSIVFEATGLPAPAEAGKKRCDCGARPSKKTAYGIERKREGNQQSCECKAKPKTEHRTLQVAASRAKASLGGDYSGSTIALPEIHTTREALARRILPQMSQEWEKVLWNCIGGNLLDGVGDALEKIKPENQLARHASLSERVSHSTTQGCPRNGPSAGGGKNSNVRKHLWLKNVKGLNSIYSGSPAVGKWQ